MVVMVVMVMVMVMVGGYLIPHGGALPHHAGLESSALFTSLHCRLPAPCSREEQNKDPNCRGLKWPFQLPGFRRGANCCMGAPRGTAVSFAPHCCSPDDPAGFLARCVTDPDYLAAMLAAPAARPVTGSLLRCILPTARCPSLAASVQEREMRPENDAARLLLARFLRLAASSPPLLVAGLSSRRAHRCTPPPQP